MTDSKTCSKCGEGKPVYSFRERGERLITTCKQCESNIASRYNKQHALKIAAYMRLWRKKNKKKIAAQLSRSPAVQHIYRMKYYYNNRRKCLERSKRQQKKRVGDTRYLALVRKWSKRRRNERGITGVTQARLAARRRYDNPETAANYRLRQKIYRGSETFKAYRLRKRPHILALDSKRNKQYTAQLVDSYIATSLRMKLGDTPQNLIEAKRAQLLLHRAVKNMNQKPKETA